MLRIVTSHKCAWRAVYVKAPGQYGRVYAHVGIDPDTIRPVVFGSFMGRKFRPVVPHIRWTYPMHPLKRWVWKGQQWVLWHLDGRR